MTMVRNNPMATKVDNSIRIAVSIVFSDGCFIIPFSYNQTQLHHTHFHQSNNKSS
jgi:hypothetical protein